MLVLCAMCQVHLTSIKFSSIMIDGPKLVYVAGR